MSAEIWQRAWRFAAHSHREQKLPGSELPYLTHLGAVTLEIVSAHLASPLGNLEYAVLCAILHDCVEDQAISPEAIGELFGAPVAAGVSALSKDPELPKAAAMADSLLRILQQPREIWCVKLADRICNLQAPPDHWSEQRINGYRAESKEILAALGAAHPLLAARLAAKIDAYPPVHIAPACTGARRSADDGLL